MLILPGNPEFDLTLALTKRPDWREVAAQDSFVAFCALPGGGGLLTPLSWKDTQDYVEGGAWDERMIDEVGFTEEELELL